MNKEKALIEERNIILSKSFRRLKGKTQVVPSEFQKIHATERLVHSLEVSTNAKIILNNFKKQEKIFKIVNETQLGNICKLHDIGHPPLGHTFEKIVNKIIKKQDFYFEGNANNLRIIEKEKINISNKTKVALIKYPFELNQKIEKGLYKYQYKKYMPQLIKEVKNQYKQVRKVRKSKKGESFLKNIKENQSIKNVIKFSNIRLLETIIMEEADDITYIIHDIKDYFIYKKEIKNNKLFYKYKNNKYISMIKYINKNNIDTILNKLKKVLIKDLKFNIEKYKIEYQTKKIKELKNFLYIFTKSQFIIEADNFIYSIINLEKYINYMLIKIEDNNFIKEYITSKTYKKELLNTKKIKERKKILINYIAEKTDKWLLEDYHIHKNNFE